MSRFVTDELKQVNLWGWEWIKIPVALSFEDTLKMTAWDKDEMSLAKQMLTFCIREWNLKDKEWNVPEVNEKNILKLDTETVTILSTEITSMMDKKNKKK